MACCCFRAVFFVKCGRPEEGVRWALRGPEAFALWDGASVLEMPVIAFCVFLHKVLRGGGRREAAQLRAVIEHHGQVCVPVCVCVCVCVCAWLCV